jgi:Ca-activated chloride channel family protein
VVLRIDLGAEAAVKLAGVLGFDILRPWLGACVIVGPALLLVGALGLRARRRARRALVAERHERRFLPRFSENRARLRVVLAACAASFIALALIGPVRGYTLRDVQRKGLDLVLCLDTSRSMLTQDVKPDRLTRAKREILGVLDKLRGDRVAIIAFAGDAREVAPLTHDRATLGAFVSSLSPDENEKGGTDIGAALEKALALFDGRTGAHEAIVLLTDGEDLEGRGLEVAKKARSRNIKVFLVGMATRAGGKIPDGKSGFIRDEEGKEVVSTLDATSLQAIADTTGGTYLSVESSPIPLEELYAKRITKLETRELFAGKERIPHDRYQWPLAVAAACILFELALRERRPENAAERALRRARSARRAELERRAAEQSATRGAA